jgi:hypothetical protein
MTQANHGPIEVFRAGSFTDMTGIKQTTTEKDLQAIAAAYDAENYPAPVVLGHPSNDAPAYGWVDRLFVEKGVLKANLRETAAEFSEWVKQGRYKKVSISLFLPGGSSNPKPEGFYLKHLGFLGAAAPAVSGLKPVKFSGDAGEAITLQQDCAFAANPDRDELAALRHEKRAWNVEKLIEQGKMLPTFKSEVLAFAASLDDSESVSFSDGTETTRAKWFMDYLAKQPQVVSYGAMRLDPAPARADARQITPEGYSVDQTHNDIYARARQIERESSVSFSQAVDMAMEGRR